MPFYENSYVNPPAILSHAEGPICDSPRMAWIVRLSAHFVLLFGGSKVTCRVDLHPTAFSELEQQVH